MVGMISTVRGAIIIYTEQDLHKKYPNAPHPRELTNRLVQPEQSLIKVGRLVRSFQPTEVDKPICVPNELIQRAEELDKINSEISEVMDSVLEYLDQYFVGLKKAIPSK